MLSFFWAAIWPSLWLIAGVLFVKTHKKVQAHVVTRVMLHNHDLDKWNYLGFITARYVNGDKVLSSHPIFLFVDKNNDKKRSYYVDSLAKTHPLVKTYVDPWAAGEDAVYCLISGATSRPSDYLKVYMRENFMSVWDTDAHWWRTSDTAKFTAASIAQKRDGKPKEVKTEPGTNIVPVKFGKQA